MRARESFFRFWDEAGESQINPDKQHNKIFINVWYFARLNICELTKIY
jgi:hypothetical protein